MRISPLEKKGSCGQIRETASGTAAQFSARGVSTTTCRRSRSPFEAPGTMALAGHWPAIRRYWILKWISLLETPTLAQDGRLFLTYPTVPAISNLPPRVKCGPNLRPWVGGSDCSSDGCELSACQEREWALYPICTKKCLFLARQPSDIEGKNCGLEWWGLWVLRLLSVECGLYPICTKKRDVYCLQGIGLAGNFGGLGCRS
jgi:hypothetical protein